MIDILARRISDRIVMSEVLDIKGAAEYLKVGEQTLYNWVNKRTIPHNKRGRKLYFLRSELLEWLQDGHVNTEKELKAGSRA